MPISIPNFTLIAIFFIIFWGSYQSQLTLFQIMCLVLLTGIVGALNMIVDKLEEINENTKGKVKYDEHA